MSTHRRTDRDEVALARRVATLISYDLPKADVVDQLRGEGYSDDDARLAYAMAKMMLKWSE